MEWGRVEGGEGGGGGGGEVGRVSRAGGPSKIRGGPGIQRGSRRGGV